MTDKPGARIRLDKWLWAARFYKTRSLAKQAIEGGKVYYNGQRVKVSKDLEVGAELRVRTGSEEKTVKVIALSEQRRGAPEAQQLYEETAESITRREQEAVLRKQVRQQYQPPPGKPGKRDRRRIHQFNEQQAE